MSAPVATFWAAFVGAELFGILCAWPARADEAGVRPKLMESIPAYIDRRRMEKRNRILDGLKNLPITTAVHPYMVILENAKWKPGRTVTVAFRGGDGGLHGEIENAASEWTQYANIHFDFGRNAATGKYRTWSLKDKDYTADVRISFDQKGYWSTVGTESRDPQIARPGEASMNFEGFDKGTPDDWMAIVRHEFGHAIGLEHEHQHPKQGCDWRWSDDEGYTLTKNKYGEYVPDKSGRHPGIYHVLGGPPNKWNKTTVDTNLRQLHNNSAYQFGPFDKLSIMKYYFDAWMFLTGDQSPCYSKQENDDLSPEDKARISEFYPKDPAVAQSINHKQLEQINALSSIFAGSPVLNLQLKRIEQLAK